LLLLDLDNTLIDRAGAFHRFAIDFAAKRHLSPEEADWLTTADRDGSEPRELLADQLRTRYGLEIPATDLADELRLGLVAHLELDPAVPAAIDRATTAGWVPFVVTHGQVAQQERKLLSTGLADHVAGWVISEGVGLRKPDPRIFRLAADRAGQPLDGAWMIGDSAANDMAGAHQAGIASIWMRRGRTWSCADFAPTMIMDSSPEAIDFVISQDRA
jgi:putative hydrolase of the HAD superfamily